MNDWANNVYGDPLTFDFPASVRDETFFGALEAVTDVLNAEDSIPPGASSEGTGQFFIGYNEILRTIVAVGGENIAGGWDQCETECTDGVALLDAGSELTWADFQKVVAPGVVQVFRTSGTYLPGFDFGNLAGGDALCQERAEAVGLNGTWTAWLSDDNTDAIDRIPDGEYQLLSGAGVIADNKDDLTDGSLKAPIFEDEFGGFPAERMQDLISKCGPGQMRMVLARTQTVTIGRIRQEMRLSELATNRILAGPIPAFRLRADKNGTSIALAAANSKFKRPDGPRARMVRGHRLFAGRPAGCEDWMVDGGPCRNLAPPLKPFPTHWDG